jgi:hypothetical protein
MGLRITAISFNSQLAVKIRFIPALCCGLLKRSCLISSSIFIMQIYIPWIIYPCNIIVTRFGDWVRSLIDFKLNLLSTVSQSKISYAGFNDLIFRCFKNSCQVLPCYHGFSICYPQELFVILLKFAFNIWNMQSCHSVFQGSPTAACSQYQIR